MKESIKNRKTLDIERKIKGCIGLRNLARSLGKTETAEKFDKLIYDLKIQKKLDINK